MAPGHSAPRVPLVHREFHRGWTLALWTVLAVFTVLLLTETGGPVVLAVLVATSLLLLATHSQVLHADEEAIELRWGAGWRRVHAPWTSLRSVEFGPSPGGAPVWAGGIRSRRRFGLGGREQLVLHFQDGTRWEIGLHDARTPGQALRRLLETPVSHASDPEGSGR